MSNLWELAAYVEDNPSDYLQRWRLAKDLYAAHEYRLALEHLQVLKNEWRPHLNARRYLGAVYYRMGRYTEAARALREAITEWPDEIALREQLAHVLTRAEEYKEALNVWEDVLQLQPGHARAEKHIQKIRILLKTTLRSPFLQDEEEDDGVYDSAAGLPPEPPLVGIICPRCGAQNSEDFERCWKCDASLAMNQDSFLNLPSVEAHGPYLLRPETISSAAMLVAFALFLVSIYFGLRLIMAFRENAVEALMDISQIYDHVLVPSRLIMSGALILWWPVALKLALRLSRVRMMPPAILLYISGIFLGSLAATLVLMPQALIFFAFLSTLFISLLLMLLAFRLHPSVALVAWTGHIVMVWLVAACSFWLAECYHYGKMIHPLHELPILRDNLIGRGVLQNTGLARLPSYITPVRQKMKWESSGSTWLDHYASVVRVTIKKESMDPTLIFKVHKGAELLMHETISDEQLQLQFPIDPEEEYEFSITGAEYALVQTAVQSLLPCTFIASPEIDAEEGAATDGTAQPDELDREITAPAELPG